MLKKIASLFLAVIMIIGFVPKINALADNSGKLSVKIHYHRFDDNYGGWNLWIWPEGADGASYAFNGSDDFGVCYEGEVPIGSAKKLGFIVRLNEWEAKDVDADRFADITKSNEDGILEFYLIQGDSTIYYNRNDADISPCFLSAQAKDEKTVVVTASQAFDFSDAGLKDSFAVADTDGNKIPISEVKPGNKSTSAELALEKEFDLSKSYIISKKGMKEIALSVTALYDTDSFNEKYYYDGDDLGAVYGRQSTSFRLWAPTASSVELNLYDNGTDGAPVQKLEMKKDVKGTWLLKVDGDLNGKYYTYTVDVGGKISEVTDPYAKAAGVNGKRGMVIDLEATNPDGWKEKSKRPEFKNPTDAVIYETHIRDFSNGKDSGMVNKGKYLAFTEKGTKNSEGLATGIDHLKELGITHVHLLPSFDYASVDESKLDQPQFNWGYDPQNYNVPEGSYSTNPYDGAVRVKEYKQMVKSLHENGIRVVMDVVYNHTSLGADSNFNLIVPGYYYRLKENGTFSNGSGCGNEIASERLMVRKFIVDSVVYWATEYKVDGFRFDLMGLLDIETMNEIRAALDKIDPTILVYGEGWDAGGSGLASEKAALKANAAKLKGIAAFSDDIRDAIKGHVFTSKESGFASGATDCVESLIFGLTGSTATKIPDFSKVKYSKSGWAGSPAQAVNYAEAHDNLTLWDKLATSNSNDSEEDRIKMDKLAASIVFTAQGIPFIQLGQDFLRTKVKEDGTFEENSYKSSDTVNNIDWSRKTKYKDVFEYYKGLIAFRKEHSALRLSTTQEVEDRVSFIKNLGNQALGYRIAGDGKGDSDVLIYYNAAKTPLEVTLPEGKWNVYGTGERVGTKILQTLSGTAKIEPISCLIMVKANETGNKFAAGVIIAAAAIAAAVAAAVFFKKMKKSAK